MKSIFLSLILCISFLVITVDVYAEGPKWVVFDPEYSQDYIDVNSITYPEKGIVRFWERAGEKHYEKGKVVYPQYSLIEMHCQLRTSRSLRWDMALEDQNTAQGVEARMKFIESMTKALGYDPTTPEREPTPWKSIEPNKHSYARYDFVCRGLQNK